MNNQTCIEDCKILIIGLDNAGKSIIRDVIFEGITPSPIKKQKKKTKIESKMVNLAGKELQSFLSSSYCYNE